jgi:[acyl-carrier-protein] S-malonyltransferase
MGKTAFIYPGQGAQYVGMGRDAAERYAAAKDVFDRADAALGFGLTDLIFNGGGEDLKKTENTQPALLTVCAALSAELTGRGVTPDASAGLSIGEYAAHALSGTFSFEDAVRTVRLRGKYMQEEVPEGVGGMAAIMGLEADSVISRILSLVPMP